MNPALTILVAALLLAGCAAPYRNSEEASVAIAKLQPVSTDRLVVKSTVTCKPGATKFTFPSGRYIPIATKNNDIYFTSPSGIHVDAIGSSYFEKGGFILTKSENGRLENPRWYVWSFESTVSECEPANAESLFSISNG